MNNFMKDSILIANQWIKGADALLVSASNGLSIAEGYHIFADNDDFRRYFGDFREKYGIRCLIQGVFVPMPEPEHRRYMEAVRRYMIEDYSGSSVMKDLKALIGEKDYMIVTSNADTHFQMNGFDPEKVFEIEGNFDDLREGSPKWRVQQERCLAFIRRYSDSTVIQLELGIGARNQLIKAPLMNLVARCPNWRFITLNMPGEINILTTIADRALALPGDIGQTFEMLLKERDAQ